MITSKEHWENIYSHKQRAEVSWTQNIPTTSLAFIAECKLDKNASIIDVGGGDSKLADYLMEEGFQDITVLDISEKAIERAKSRLKDQANKITWIVSDIMDFTPTKKYDLWHDRAAFHFLTSNAQIEKYLRIAQSCISNFLIIGTFSDKGPAKCSGLEIKRYSEDTLQQTLHHHFTKIKCLKEDHITPFGTKQNFLFCSFKVNNMDL